MRPHAQFIDFMHALIGEIGLDDILRENLTLSRNPWSAWSASRACSSEPGVDGTLALSCGGRS